MTYENCIFEGGGVRGFAYCGVVDMLDQLGKLKCMKRFAGTSTGSLFAAMLAADFTAEEVMEAGRELDFSEISRGFCLFTVYGIWCNYGVNYLSLLGKQFRKILSTKVCPEITMKELFDITGKELVIVTCCLNRELPVYIHHENFPDVKVVDALLSSISVPFIFQPQKQTFLGKEDYYVDGGVVDNYPIWIFNDLDALYENRLDDVDKDEINPKTIGFKLLCKNEENNREVKSGRSDIQNVFQFGVKLINTLTTQIERANISDSYIRQTVPIKAEVYFMDFDLSPEKITQLISSGQKSTKEYFSKKKIE